MKRAIYIAVLLAMSLSACGQKETGSDEQSPAPAAAPAQPAQAPAGEEGSAGSDESAPAANEGESPASESSGDTEQK